MSTVKSKLRGEWLLLANGDLPLSAFDIRRKLQAAAKEGDVWAQKDNQTSSPLVNLSISQWSPNAKK